MFAEKTVSIKELQLCISLKQPTIYRYITELKIDIAEEFNNKVFLSSVSKRGVRIETCNNLSTNYLISKLQLKYFKESSIYPILKAITQKNYTSATSLANDIHLSNGATHKYLKAITHILEIFNCKLSFTHFQNIAGDEYAVRYFLYLLHWDLFSTIDPSPIANSWSHDKHSIKHLKETLGITKQLSSSQETQLTIIAGIVASRLKHSSDLSINDEQFLDETRYFYRGAFCSWLTHLPIDSEIIKRETQFLSFFIRIIMFDIDDLSEKERIVKSYENSKLSIMSMVNNFCIAFKSSLSESFKQRDIVELKYILIITFLSFKYYNFISSGEITLPTDNYVVSPSKRYEALREHKELNAFITEFSDKYNLSDTQCKVLQSIVYWMYDLKFELPKLNIYISHATNILAGLYIKNVVLNVFNSKSVSFCNSPSKADIVISNVYEKEFQTKHNFYFENPNDPQTWESLISFISLCLTSRIY